MIYIIVGVILMVFTFYSFALAIEDFTEDVKDISPFEDEVLMVEFIQKISSYIMTILVIVSYIFSLGIILKGVIDILG